MRYLNLREIGNRLLTARKRMGFTQAEMAELAGISDRAYADIERGSVNMRIETFLLICQALHASPNQLLTEENETTSLHQEELLQKLNACPLKARETALKLLAAYLDAELE